MVRHECAEALGAIATDECTEILKTYAKDKEVKFDISLQFDISPFEFRVFKNKSYILKNEFHVFSREWFAKAAKSPWTWPNTRTATNYSTLKFGIKGGFPYIPMGFHISGSSGKLPLLLLLN